MNTWKDEKELVILSLIASTLMIFLVGETMGYLYSIFIIIYFLVIGTPYAIQFRKSKQWISGDSFISIAIGLLAFIFIGGLITGQTNILSIFRMMSINIQSSTPMIEQILIWGIFIPFAETLFIFGVIFGYLRKKFKFSLNLNIESIVTIVILSSILALYHVKTQGLSQSVFLMDIVFVTISGLIIAKKDELRDGFYFHALINIIRILIIGGGFISLLP